ncbi:MAG: response regulator [Mariprofundales bacterium]|nr:response regulator [Mariprofundales bacterium]
MSDIFCMLLIEDNPADARLVEEALRENKVLIDLHTVPDGELALDYLHQRGQFSNATPPDLILLDLNLPGMDGREILAHIKQDPVLRSTPTIILTTSQADRDIVETYQLSANAYVIKPLDFEQFMNIIRDTAQFWLSVAVLPDGRNTN